MKLTRKESKEHTFDKEVDRILLKLKEINPDTKEYAEVVKNLATLTAARSNKDYSGVSMDTLVTVAANLVGILVILNFEKANILTSKAVNFVIKGRS